MQAMTSFFMAVISFVSSLFGIGPKTPVIPADASAFEPTVRFMVCSDTHVDPNAAERIGRIPAALNFAYDIAESDDSYKNLDAAMFVGDVTNNGTEEQFAMVKKDFETGLRDGTKLLAICARNHDGYAGTVALDRMSEITGMDSDFHVVINGFHFIGISRTNKDVSTRYSPYQRQWLREQLAAAEADDPAKPIFVCNHEHVFGTVYGSQLIEGWGVTYFNDILAQYPQVVHFSGHSHYPLNDPRSVQQGKFTTVGTGSMAYMEFTYHLDRSIHPAGNNQAAQAWIVEADAENRIRLTGFDALTGDILCRYLLPSLTDKSTFAYTTPNMKKLSSAPAFAGDAAVTLVKNEDGTVTATAPAAASTDGNIIFLYRVRVFNGAGIQTHSEYIINNYWQKNTYETVSFTVEAQKGYRIEITAENAYDMESAPVSTTVQ